MFVFFFFKQITNEDLEQRHPQLDSVFTLAQNLKNKTSSSDIRTAITEKCMFLFERCMRRRELSNFEICIEGEE